MPVTPTAGSVVVVDDDPNILRALTMNLTARGYEVHEAATGQEALAAAAEHRPQVMILDLVLPDMGGIEVLRSLRRWSSVPVLILSARGGERDKIAALDAGADDYVAKPFSMDELLARLRAAQRRTTASHDPSVVTTDAFEVDLVSRTVTVGGRPVHLTPTERGIVELLVRNPNRLVTRQAILKAVWGSGHADESGYLRVHMASVRRKLEPDPSHPRYFFTEPRLGYRFIPDEPDGPASNR
jgi:two-component system, OmpR family, KDP operon response regulator KdpE